jgi:hypothetical protein
MRCEMIGTGDDGLAYPRAEDFAGQEIDGMGKRGIASIAALALLAAAGCRIQVDKNDDGKDKNVKIDTPLGGLHVRTDKTAAADVGLPAYPGAQIAADKDGDKAADVHMGFGEWQLRVKVVTYKTSDPQDKVVAFYQKALGRYGDVVECEGNHAVGSPTVTHEGLDCSDDKSSAQVKISDDSSMTSLKAGSKRHQHIFAVQKSDTSGTRFSLVELQLPTGLDENSKDSN